MICDNVAICLYLWTHCLPISAQAIQLCHCVLIVRGLAMITEQRQIVISFIQRFTFEMSVLFLVKSPEVNK